MEIGVLDYGGNFCGPALGLALRGHSVHYRGVGGFEPGDPTLRHFAPTAPSQGGHPCFEAELEPILGAPLVIVAASFADETWCRELGIQGEAPVRPEDPLFASINPKQAEFRNRWLESRLGNIRRLVLVDMSDEGELDPWFCAHGESQLKRELPLWEERAGVRAFPYLYHPQLLRVEFAGQLDQTRVSPQIFGRVGGAFFGGTLGHWRYGGRRRRILERVRRRYPKIPIQVAESGLTVLETWERMQWAQAGLYLPGKGELCFRLHELAAFGVPCWAPFEPSIQLPEAWLDVFRQDPEALALPTQMLSFYLHHYHPTKAADALCQALGLPVPAQSFEASCSR